MRTSRAIPLFLLALFCCCGQVLALETEESGNDPLNGLNYAPWPGIILVINESSRVFHTWVSGNENFYYRGDTVALNDALRKFADITAKAHEVILRPGPGITSTWDQKQSIPFNWNMHVTGGLDADMSKRDLGNIVWNESPMLTVYVGGDIQLMKLEIPPGTTVISVADLAQRYRKALASTDQEVRGWSAGELADLDPYDRDSMTAITALLKDKDNWVRLNAAYALPFFGKMAEPALPALRESLNTQDEQLKAKIQKAIEEIQQAKDNSADERQHRDLLTSIADFCKSAQTNSR